MISPSDTRRESQIRIYDREESAVFLKTNEEFGGLSNMAGGYPLVVNGIRIFTSEALYQACRFPHMPEVQQLIIAQASPMTAKMKSKPYRGNSRPDWNQVRVKVMRWCLRVKLAQNWTQFSELLLATGDRPIVEASRRDEFWGARPVDDRTLMGMNVLGRLLMELREEVRNGVCTAPMRVEPLPIPDFLLKGQPVQPVIGRDESDRRSAQRQERRVMAPEPTGMAVQVAMFDRPLASTYSERQKSKAIEAIGMDGQRVEKQAATRIQLPDENAEIDRLSNILKIFNDQFGTIPWTDIDRVHRLITEDIPARVAADAAYQNAKQSSDPQNARIEHDKALGRVMTAVLKDDTELFKQFSDNDYFRRWLTDTVFGITCDRCSTTGPDVDH